MAVLRMNVTFGLRYTHDEKEFSWLNGPRQAPELDATVAALDEMGFFEAVGIPPEAYNFDVVFAFPPILVGDQTGGPERTVSTSAPHSVAATPDCTLSV